MVLLHQDSDQQHGDHSHLPGSLLLSPSWIQNTQQVLTNNNHYLYYARTHIPLQPFFNYYFLISQLVSFQEEVFESGCLGCYHPTHGLDRLVPSAVEPFLAGR